MRKGCGKKKRAMTVLTKETKTKTEQQEPEQTKNQVYILTNIHNGRQNEKDYIYI